MKWAGNGDRRASSLIGEKLGRYMVRKVYAVAVSEGRDGIVTELRGDIT